MPGDTPNGRSCPRWRGRPLLLTGTAVAAVTMGTGLALAEIQNGRVTAVSRSSITLKSGDGFARTYAVTSTTIVAARRDDIGSVKAGDQAWVTATASGGTVTAIRIGDLSQLRSGPGDLPGPAGQRFIPPSRRGSAAAFSGSLAGG